jgi:hypothetical protein
MTKLSESTFKECLEFLKKRERKCPKCKSNRWNYIMLFDEKYVKTGSCYECQECLEQYDSQKYTKKRLSPT